MPPLSYLRYASAAARPAPLLLAALFSVGLALAAAAGLFGLLLALILVSWTFKYAFICFDAIARGLHEPPVLSVEMVNPADEQRPLGMLLIIGVFYAATAALAHHVPALVTNAVRLLGLLLLPASVLALAVTGRIIDAVNPRVLVDLVRRLGVDYAGLIATVMVLAFAQYLLWRLPVWLTVEVAFGLFSLLALSCIMGGIVYERRAELGIDAWHTPERIAARQAREATQALDREFDTLYALCRAGSYDAAWSALEAKLAAANHEFETYRQFHARMARWPDERMADRLAKEFVGRYGARAEAIVSKKVAPPASKTTPVSKKT